MDGTEAVRLIRRGAAPGAAVPIIALTADAIPESRARYLEAGCDAVVTKPIEWHVLVREIKKLLERPLGGTIAAEPAAVSSENESPGGESLPVFDPQRIDGLREGLGPALMSNLLARCLAAMEQYLGDVMHSASVGDFAQVRRSAYDLKSVCAQFGALSASEIARKIEADLPDLEAMKTALADLKDSVESATAAIQHIQNGMSASGVRTGRSAA